MLQCWIKNDKVQFALMIDLGLVFRSASRCYEFLDCLWFLHHNVDDARNATSNKSMIWWSIRSIISTKAWWSKVSNWSNQFTETSLLRSIHCYCHFKCSSANAGTHASWIPPPTGKVLITRSLISVWEGQHWAEAFERALLRGSIEDGCLWTIDAPVSLRWEHPVTEM